MVLIVCGQLTNLTLCNTFYVAFLVPLETLHILTLGMTLLVLMGLLGSRDKQKEVGTWALTCLQQVVSVSALV